jgi:uncharacterized protein
MSIISNTTVISNFVAITQLDRLRELFGEVFISTEVYEEIQRGLEEGYDWYQAVNTLLDSTSSSDWLKLTSLSGGSELLLYQQMPKRLHQGEASSIAIAHTRQWTFLTDDLAARNEAKRLDIRVSGTVGCLVQLVEQNHCKITQVNQYLSQMIGQGYRSPVRDLAALINLK